jgi:hypothetical protein
MENMSKCGRYPDAAFLVAPDRVVDLFYSSAVEHEKV